MKEIKIFLASSYELESDRVRFGDMIYRLNAGTESRGFHLTLVKWEDLPGFYEHNGQQSSYNRHIESSHIFTALFWHKVGKHTLNELEIAKNSANTSTSIFLRDQNCLLSAEEENLYTIRYPDKRIEDFNANSGNPDSFLQEHNDVVQKRYRSFDELETAFKLLLENWIKDNGDKLADNWQPAKERHDVISFSEAALNFDLANICDLLRKLNQMKWGNYQLTPSVENANLMFCLNCTAVSEEQALLIDRFNNSDSDSSLLLLQRKNQDRSSGNELKNWYSQKKQYPVSYGSVDTLLLRFMQHLLLHFPERNNCIVKRGTLFLESSVPGIVFPAVNLLGTNEFSGDEIKELVKELTICDEKVEKCRKIYNQDPSNLENAGSYSEALSEQRKSLEKLDQKIKTFLELQQSFYQTHLQCNLEKYEENCRLLDSGDITGFVEQMEKETPADSDIQQHCSELLKMQIAENESRKEQIAANNHYSAARKDTQNRKDLLKKDFYFLINGAYAALYQKQPDKAMKLFNNADKIFRLIPGCLNDVFLALKVLLPLAQLQEESGCFQEAITTFGRSKKILSDSSESQYSNPINSILLNIGICYARLSEHNNALTYLNQVTSSSHSQNHALYSIASICCDFGDYNNALKAYFKVYQNGIKANNSNFCARCTMAITNVLLHQQKHEPAKLFFARAIEFYSKFFSETHEEFNAAEIANFVPENFTKTYDRCMHLLQIAVLKFPESDDILKERTIDIAYTAVKVFAFERKYEEAHTVADKILSLYHNSLTSSCKHALGLLALENGRIYYWTKSWSKVLEYLDIAEKYCFRTPIQLCNIYISQAKALMQSGEFEQALSKSNKASKCVSQVQCDRLKPPLYEELYTIHNKINEQCEELGNILQKEKYLNAELKICKKRLEISSEDKKLVFKLLRRAGTLCRQLQDFQTAAEYYEQIIRAIEKEKRELTTGDATIFNEAARILFELKDYAKALEYAQRGLEILRAEFSDSNAIIIQCRTFLNQLKETAAKSSV